jgi:hypothetical protein
MDIRLLGEMTMSQDDRELAVQLSLPFWLCPSGTDIHLSVEETPEEHLYYSSLTAWLYVPLEVLAQRRPIGFTEPQSVGCSDKFMQSLRPLSQLMHKPYALAKFYFESGTDVRTYAGDYQVVEESGRYRKQAARKETPAASNSINARIEQLNQDWIQAGVSGSSIYLVPDSRWRKEFRPDEPLSQHFVIVGHDLVVEVLAHGFTWTILEERDI